MSEIQKDHDACPEKPKNEVGMSSERRDFLKKAGTAGLAAGLAHFLLVGGKVQKVHAACDMCGSQGGSYNDVCKPSKNDPDTCFPDYFASQEYDDDCPETTGGGDSCWGGLGGGTFGDDPNH